MQVVLVAHAWPHVPQLELSVIVSTQTLLQSVIPPEHWQVLFVQLDPPEHTLLHWPQLLSSMLVSTHRFPHTVYMQELPSWMGVLLSFWVVPVSWVVDPSFTGLLESVPLSRRGPLSPSSAIRPVAQAPIDKASPTENTAKPIAFCRMRPTSTPKPTKGGVYREKSVAGNGSGVDNLEIATV